MAATNLISIATINVHGMTYDKILSLDQHIKSKPLHLLVITETHQSAIPSWMAFDSFPNSLHRLGTKHSGGVSIFTSLPITERPHLLSHMDNTLACEIHTPAGPRTIVGAYQFNDGEDIDDPQFNILINNISEIITRSAHPVIILGDLNMKHPQWSPGTIANQQATLFKSILDDNDLHIVNTMFNSSNGAATHDRGHTLDLILTNTPRSFSSCSIIDNDTIGIYTIWYVPPYPHSPGYPQERSRAFSCRGNGSRRKQIGNCLPISAKGIPTIRPH